MTAFLKNKNIGCRLLKYLQTIQIYDNSTKRFQFGRSLSSHGTFQITVKRDRKAKRVMETVSSDICRPITPSTFDDKRYVFSNHYSHLYVTFWKQKWKSKNQFWYILVVDVLVRISIFTRLLAIIVFLFLSRKIFFKYCLGIILLYLT